MALKPLKIREYENVDGRSMSPLPLLYQKKSWRYLVVNIPPGVFRGVSQNAHSLPLFEGHADCFASENKINDVS